MPPGRIRPRGQPLAKVPRPDSGKLTPEAFPSPPPHSSFALAQPRAGLVRRPWGGTQRWAGRGRSEAGREEQGWGKGERLAVPAAGVGGAEERSPTGHSYINSFILCTWAQGPHPGCQAVPPARCQLPAGAEPPATETGGEKRQVPSAQYPLPTAHCPVPTAHCPVLSAYCPLLTTHCSLLSAHYPLPTAQYPLPNAHCSVPTTHCPLPSAHCPIPTAHCPVPTAQLTLPPAHHPLPTQGAAGSPAPVPTSPTQGAQWQLPAGEPTPEEGAQGGGAQAGALQLLLLCPGAHELCQLPWAEQEQSWLRSGVGWGCPALLPTRCHTHGRPC